MRYLVTGGAGFIGGHLVVRLLGLGHDVVVLDNLTRLSPVVHDPGWQGAELVIGDIRDEAVVARAMDGADVVFHLAAQSQVVGSARDQQYAFTSNVSGTLNVLQAARSSGVRRLVFASSREVYGEPARLPVREDAPIAPKNVYGASKAASEAYCRALGQTDTLSSVILRLANVYGPGDHGRVVPLFIERALEGDDLEIYGGKQVLDLIWVGTVVEAMVRASELPVATGPINVGSGRGVLIGMLAGRILRVTRSASRIVHRPARGIEVDRFTADVSRMESVLGLRAPADPLSGIDVLVDGRGDPAPRLPRFALASLTGAAPAAPRSAAAVASRD